MWREREKRSKVPLFSSSKIIQFFVSDEFRVFVRIIWKKKRRRRRMKNAPALF